MKKLMLAAAIVCAAVMAQAATVSWANGEYTSYAGGAAAADGETMYLIRTASHSQADFVSMLLAAEDLTSVQTTVASWKVDTTTGSDIGAFEQNGTTTSAFSTGSSEEAYVVLFDTVNNNVFMSASETAGYDGVSDAYSFDFNAMSLASDQEAFTDYTESQGAGWYAAAPEPTSGLLLLIGMAGLALRRRRA